MEGEFFDFGQELRLHLAQAQAFLAYLRLGGDIPQVVILLDEGVNLTHGAERAVRLEYVVRAGAADDYSFGADGASDLQQLHGRCRADADVAGGVG